jgi:large subunit ribosomal protein L22
MTGPKLNEKSFVAGERSGTKATAKYVRTSASKARAVLDLIRGLDVATADQVLQFTERHVAHDVRKVLAGAVANAVNNDGQEAEELFVIACFADEGPTLKRFRPRARGRASRINKRTCHITVIVARMSDERIEVIQARAERAGGSGGRGRPTSSAASRRARVERSRQKDAESTDAEATDADSTDADATSDDSSEPAEGTASDEPAIETGSASDEAGAESDQTPSAETEGEDEAVEVGQYSGSVLPPDDGGVPEGYEVKGNVQSMLYHEPGSRYYRATKAEVWFDSAESAVAAGFTKPGASKQSSEDSTESAGAEGSASDEETGTADEKDNS